MSQNIHFYNIEIQCLDIKESDDPSQNELIKTLIDVKSRIPPYVRINRLKPTIKSIFITLL